MQNDNARLEELGLTNPAKTKVIRKPKGIPKC
jgi:hypothetical protein